MYVGYGKIGRTIALDSSRWGVVGGDMEPPRLLLELARRHPDVTWVIVGQCKDNPQACGYPPNVVNMWTPERRRWLREQSNAAPRVPSEKGKHKNLTVEGYAHLQRAYDALALPAFDKLDGVILWLGQHGTSNYRIPAISDRAGEADGYTKPDENYFLYSGFLISGLNHWQDADPATRDAIWLIADARNYLKARDVKWPLRHPVLGQYDFEYATKHERYGDPRQPSDFGLPGAPDKDRPQHIWKAPHRYAYSGLEACSLGPEIIGDQYFDGDWEQRSHFGLYINEARSYVNPLLARKTIVKQWVMPLEPAFIHGQWPESAQRELGRDVTVVPFEDFYSVLRSTRCTFTTPSSGSGWLTTKPWEAFAAGVVCFFHPQYDTQDHLLSHDAELREWLRVQTPDDLRKRVEHLSNDHAAWLWIVRRQKALYDQLMRDRPWIARIEERLNLNVTVGV